MKSNRIDAEIQKDIDSNIDAMNDLTKEFNVAKRKYERAIAALESKNDRLKYERQDNCPQHEGCFQTGYCRKCGYRDSSYFSFGG